CSVFFFSSRRRHTRFSRDWSSDVCSSDLGERVLGSSAAADYRWAVGELRSALAPLLASAAIDAIRVVRRADGRVLLDSTGETLGRMVPEVLDALAGGRVVDGPRVAALPTPAS